MGGADPLASWRIAAEPYYRATGDEVALFGHAHARRLPLLLQGPSGCGKTRFVEHMAWRLGLPLVTVACHEEMTASDLVGRWLLDAQGTSWQDGPLALAARHGAICYLDELAEARPDALVVLHPLADTRRALPLERRGELLRAHADFHLVASCNPTPDRVLKAATQQRFVALAFTHPDASAEEAIVAHEAGLAPAAATRLVALGAALRRALAGAREALSTRMLVHAAQLLAQGAPWRDACEMAWLGALDGDAALATTLRDLLDAHSP